MTVVERPLRQEIALTIRRLVSEAEAKDTLKRHYSWHRRFALGIDCSLGAAEKRARDAGPFDFPQLQKAAEMAAHWLRAQTLKSDSFERGASLNLSLTIYEELTG